MKILYGYQITTPQWACRLEVVPLTWQQRVRAALYDVLFEIQQAALFAASVTCFAYAFGAFR